MIDSRTFTNTNKAPLQESPQIRNPQSASATQQTQKATAKKKVPLQAIIAVLVLVLLILGGGAAFFLSQQSQDVRQQASVYDTNQCQDGNNNRDSDYVLLCECPNGCSYKTDNSTGGGGGGWVCDQNCHKVPKGTSSGATCQQTDFVHQGTSDYCGVSNITCPASCQGGGGGGSPAPSPTPPTSPGVSPSPSPAPGSCQSIQVDKTSVKKGDKIHFTCGQVATATRYQFRVKMPSGGFQTVLAASGSANKNISEDFTITESGNFKAQCRICTGTPATCQAWETL
jgi:hypothetical protein